MAAHEQITVARKMGREVIVDLDVQALAIETSPLSTKEIGREWLALLRGQPSVLSSAVVRVRSRAPSRRRIAGWRATRIRIFNRDGWTCTYCGSTRDLECDHIVPFSKGGSNEDDNLTTACKPCNRAKGDLAVDEWRS